MTAPAQFRDQAPHWARRVRFYNIQLVIPVKRSGIENLIAVRIAPRGGGHHPGQVHQVANVGAAVAVVARVPWS